MIWINKVVRMLESNTNAMINKLSDSTGQIINILISQFTSQIPLSFTKLIRLG